MSQEKTTPEVEAKEQDLSELLQIRRDKLKALQDAGFDGYIRPDHGRMIWGETGKPGYGLYDRALGAMYMAGIWETLEKEKQ